MAQTSGFRVARPAPDTFQSASVIPALQGFNPSTFVYDMISPSVAGFRMGQQLVEPGVAALKESIRFNSPEAKQEREYDAALKKLNLEKMEAQGRLAPLQNQVAEKLLNEQLAELGLAPEERARAKGALKDFGRPPSEIEKDNLNAQEVKQRMELARQNHAQKIAEIEADKTLSDLERKAKVVEAGVKLKDYTDVLNEGVDSGYGNRADGTKKGSGFLGPQKTSDGKTATEISVGVNIDGKEVDIPTMVPTLPQAKIDYLLNGGDPRKDPEIMKLAIDHAGQRIASGKSPFADESKAVVSDPYYGLGEPPSQTLIGARKPGTLSRKEIKNPAYERWEDEFKIRRKSDSDLRSKAEEKGMADAQTAKREDVSKFLGTKGGGEKMTSSDKHLVDTLSTKNANKISIINQIEGTVKQLEDPKVDERTKLAVAKQLLKTLNSPEGADAVGVEEAHRLGSLLEYGMGSPWDWARYIKGEGDAFGRDMNGFISQAKATKDSIKTGVTLNNDMVNKVNAKYGVEGDGSLATSGSGVKLDIGGSTKLSTGNSATRNK